MGNVRQFLPVLKDDVRPSIFRTHHPWNNRRLARTFVPETLQKLRNDWSDKGADLADALPHINSANTNGSNKRALTRLSKDLLLPKLESA